jgi:hypothetical protein
MHHRAGYWSQSLTLLMPGLDQPLVDDLLRVKSQEPWQGAVGLSNYLRITDVPECATLVGYAGMIFVPVSNLAITNCGLPAIISIDGSSRTYL